MKRTFHFNYFELSFSFIIKSQFIILLIFFIEHITLLLENVKSLVIGMNILIKNSNNITTLKEYNDTYFLNHLSLLYGFRNLISSDYNLYPSTLYIIIIILLFVYYIFLFCKIMHSNHIIASIIVNFYDLCFFRLLTIINIDVIVNYLFVKQHPFITNVFINIFISSILIIIIFIAYINHYQYIFIYLKYNDNIKYPLSYLLVYLRSMGIISYIADSV